MKHHFIDHYWTIKSPVHTIDPRLKLIGLFVALFAVVVTPNGRFLDYFFFAPLFLILLIAARLPFMAVFRRMAVVIPLVTIIAVSLLFMNPGNTGLVNFASVVTKALLAVWIMTLLTATTSFKDLLSAMRRLRFPVIITSLMGFIYRYIFLFIDEAEHLNIARKSRSFGNNIYLAMKGFGWMLSSLFIRSFERGERIYQAMCSRGFTGEHMTLAEMKASNKDIITTILFVFIIFAIKYIGRKYG